MATPHAFLSYTRVDDDAYDITGLRVLIEKRARAVLGDRNFRIFQDIDGIKAADEWQERLDEAVREASLFIAILTPSFLKSKPCRDELTKFLEIEEVRVVGPLVVPLYLVTVREVEHGSASDPLAIKLQSRQRFDWRPVRDLGRTSELFTQRLQALAESIAEIVHRSSATTSHDTGLAKPKTEFDRTSAVPSATPKPVTTGYVDPSPSQSNPSPTMPSTAGTSGTKALEAAPEQALHKQALEKSATPRSRRNSGGITLHEVGIHTEPASAM